MKEKRKRYLRVLIFCIIIFITLVSLNKFFKPAFFGWNIYYTTQGFYEEPEDTIETLFLGSSVVARGVTPTELYEKYGMCSYNLAIANAPMLINYYWLEEAYRLQSESLKTVVFDVSSLRSDADPETYHKALDGMKLSKVKWNAVRDYAGDDYSEMATFFFPLIYYHDRWSSIGESDFQKYTESPVNGTRGYHFVTFKNAVNLLEGENEEEKKKVPLKVFNPELDEDAKPAELLDNSMYYFEKMVKFCEEKGIELVLAKVPTRRWSSSLHHAVKDVADEYGLEYLDYNYSPLYEETDIIYAYETSDVNHLNYYGAAKFTEHLGKYLVDNYKMTDVRGNEKYAHMEEQLGLYQETVYNELALKGSETVTEYLENALKYDNTVMISVKNTAASALTKEQRNYFSEVGLEKLSQIEYRDSYIGIIENGKVIHEELKKASTEKDQKGKCIAYKGKLENGVLYELTSGGFYQGNKTSCEIESESYSADENGLNITVYNNASDKVVDYTVFQTDSSRIRECYGSKTLNKILAGEESVSFDSDSLYSKVQEYKKMSDDLTVINEIRDSMGKNDIFTFLNGYWNDENKMIFISVKDDASKALVEKDRTAFAELGLVSLASIDYRDSYLAYIDGGEIIYDICSSKDTPVVVDELGLYIKSAGRYAGNSSSIQINGVEYSENERGMNVVIYDKVLKRVVDSKVFDTCKVKIKH